MTEFKERENYYIMKKIICTLMCFIMLMSPVSAFARTYSNPNLNPAVNPEAEMRVDEFIAVLSHYSYWSAPSAAPYAKDKAGQLPAGWAAPYVQTEINKGVIKGENLVYSDKATIAFAARYMSNAKGKYQWDYVNNDYVVTGDENLTAEDKMYLNVAFDYGLIKYYKGINVSTPIKRKDIPSLNLVRELPVPRKRAQQTGANSAFVVNAFFEGRNNISDTDTGYANLVKYKDKITHVTFYGASIVGDGTIETNYSDDEYTSKAIAFCNANNIKPLLGLQNYKNGYYNAGVVSSAFNGYMEQTADSVVAAVDQYNLAGVNVVLEFAYDSERNNHTKFVQLLSNKLRAKGKILMVTVGAYFDEATEQSCLYDYTELGKAADYINITLYDDNSANAFNRGTIRQPGCMSNLVRIDRVLKFAEHKIPHNKILLSTAGYGVDFDMANMKAQTIGFSAVHDLAAQSSGWICDTTEGSGHFTYGNNHVVYAETEPGIKERINVAVINGLAGVSYFSLSSDFAPFFKHLP